MKDKMSFIALLCVFWTPLYYRSRRYPLLNKVAALSSGTQTENGMPGCQVQTFDL